jgi:hypothetical protein
MKLLAASYWLLAKEATTKKRQQSALSIQLSSQNQAQNFEAGALTVWNS